MSETLEYLFFTRPICDQFIDVLNKKKIPWKEAVESVHGYMLIHILEDDIDAYWDEIDDLYDELTIEDQHQLEQGGDNADDVSTAGVYIQLKNNQQTVAQVNPDVLNRILGAITSDEFSAFVDVIAKSVEEPDDAPVCQREGL